MNAFCPKWERVLEKIKNVKPVLQGADHCELPRISNIVSTAILLPQTKDSLYKLPLDAISMSLACSQYAPVLFAANIIKLTDSITNSTILVFASGKIVVTACLSLNHTRYISQLVRAIIEQVNCMMLMPPDGKLVQGSLVGRTVFEKCTIHNIVGNGDLGCRIDLQSMCDAAPTNCKWVPDLFPGLKCKIWLTDSRTCVCGAGSRGHDDDDEDDEEDDDLGNIVGKQIATTKCSCIVKVILYDTGQVVIIGARSVADVNTVFFRIKQEIPRLPRDKIVPKDGRFYKRLGDMMVPAATAAVAVGRKKLVLREMKPSEALSVVMANMNSGVSQPPANKKHKVNESALLKMAKAGRVDQVTLVLQMDPTQVQERDEDGFTVAERMQMIEPQERSRFHREIVDLLVAAAAGNSQ